MIRTLYGDAVKWPTEAWDPMVLGDRHHPLFLEHKRRFEVWQDAQGDDDG